MNMFQFLKKFFISTEELKANYIAQNFTQDKFVKITFLGQETIIVKESIVSVVENFINNNSENMIQIQTFQYAIDSFQDYSLNPNYYMKFLIPSDYMKYYNYKSFSINEPFIEYLKKD